MRLQAASRLNSGKLFADDPFQPLAINGNLQSLQALLCKFMSFPLDQKWIDVAEQELGRVLPESYKNRLKRDNGGEIEAAGDSWILHPIFDQSDRKRLKRTCNHVLAETRSSRSWRGFPADAIAIAANGSGDQLILLVDEESDASFGSMIWLWNHETAHIDPIADFAEVAPLRD